MVRFTDIRSPLSEALPSIDRANDHYCECDLCGHVQFIGNGTFVPHGGMDMQNVQFPSTFYVSGALDLDLVRTYYDLVETVSRYYLAYNPNLVGKPPPADLYQEALNIRAGKRSVISDYVFTKNATYLWDTQDMFPTYRSVQYALKGVDTTVLLDTPQPDTPTSAPFEIRSPTVSPTTQPTAQPSLRATVPPTSVPTRAPFFSPQSGNVMITTDIGDTDEQHVIKFDDENADWMASIRHSKDDSFYVADTGDVSLENFFRRPIKLYTHSWDYNTSSGWNINPWKLFFDNPRIANRLANYRNLRCNLRVKILVNGTPFDYGRAMVFYTPLASRDKYQAPPVAAGLDSIVTWSQRMHLYLDPTTSQGGTMELPYFWPYNSLNIPSNEWEGLGDLTMVTVVPLKNCNGSPNPITISVFAWAEDVVLSTPTSTEPNGLVAQMGRDEYGEGIISRPAAILAKVAGRLAHVPYIGPYATAAQVGAGHVGDIAKIFGLSKPNIVSDVMYVKQDPFASMTNTDRPDSIAKLTYDSKQAVTIDPRTAGLDGQDELSIVEIAKRESFLTAFPWTQVHAPETMIFNIAVTPQLYVSGKTPLSGGRIVSALLPCAAMTLPYSYWRGSMKYRFQIVKSAFHKGRLRIVYEPEKLVLGTCEYNTNLSEILDIGDNIDFEVIVGWHAHVPYLQCFEVGAAPTNLIYKSTQGATGPAPIVTSVDLPGFINGSLSVFVVNTLECPASAATVDNTIQVMVSASACEDFEVFGPSEKIDNYTYSPQMGAEKVMPTPETGSPLGAPTIVQFGNSISNTDKTPLICHGDPVVNIRSILKRYTLCDTFRAALVATPAATAGVWTLQMSAYPNQRGIHPFGNSLLGLKTANVAKFTPLNFYSLMFAAKRGGMRNKFIDGTTATKGASRRIVRPSKATFSNIVSPLAFQVLTDSFQRDRLAAHHTGATGMSIAITANEHLEAEIPYSANARFLGTRDMVPATSIDYPIRVEIDLPIGGDRSQNILDRYVAVADDFNLFWFQGIPPITYLPAPLVIS